MTVAEPSGMPLLGSVVGQSGKKGAKKHRPRPNVDDCTSTDIGDLH